MKNPLEATFFPLSEAFLCSDCNFVGNCSTQCPACASSVLMSLNNVLGDVHECGPAELSEYAVEKALYELERK
jgi:hypothetical protein